MCNLMQMDGQSWDSDVSVPEGAAKSRIQRHFAIFGA